MGVVYQIGAIRFFRKKNITLNYQFFSPHKINLKTKFSIRKKLNQLHHPPFRRAFNVLSECSTQTRARFPPLDIARGVAVKGGTTAVVVMVTTAFPPRSHGPAKRVRCASLVARYGDMANLHGGGTSLDSPLFSSSSRADAHLTHCNFPATPMPADASPRS